MTVCLSGRLKRLLSGLNNMSAQQDGGRGVGVFEILQRQDAAAHTDLADGEQEEALFDEQTGHAGFVATCTLQLFSPEFRAQYSSDEQCQMIHVLARMQSENCARLLKRLASVCGSHQARSGRIRVMEKRLREAGDATDECLEAISQAFSLQV